MQNEEMINTMNRREGLEEEVSSDQRRSLKLGKGRVKPFPRNRTPIFSMYLERSRKPGEPGLRELSHQQIKMEVG